MAGHDGEDEHFLEEIRKLNVLDVLYQEVNGIIPTHNRIGSTPAFVQLACKEFPSDMRHHIAKRNYEVVKGKDLVVGSVKLTHYTHQDLEEFTHDIYHRHVLFDTLYGRFFVFETPQATLKTWDIRYPECIDKSSIMHKFHARRLCNEISLLTSEPYKSYQYLPKLIGYSIDTTLAIVYGFKASSALLHQLCEDELEWDSRFKVVVQVAELLKFFHDHKRFVGSIDVQNILLDKDGNIKLCEFIPCFGNDDVEFDPCIPLEHEEFRMMHGVGLYLKYASEVYIGGKVGLATDVYGFGNVLVEVMTRKRLPYSILGRRTFIGKMLDISKIKTKSSEGANLIKNCREELQELASSCLHNEPEKRPRATVILEQLNTLQNAFLKAVQ